MDGFKVVCIFAKVEFVGYVSNMCTIRLRLELCCNFGRLGIEFGSYFVSLGPINMRALPCNRDMIWWLVWAARCRVGARIPVQLLFMGSGGTRIKI